MGTAAYMAPEQARGQAVDKRADIWAFGVVFYELITGADPFGGGKNVSDTLAVVLTREPDFGALPKDTPRGLRRLLEHCLRKDPRQRMRDIGDARILLDEPEFESPAPSKPRRAGNLVYGAALLAMIAVAAGLWYFRWAPPVREAERPAVPLTAESGSELSASFSPDGNEVVYAWNGEKRDNFDIYRKRIGGGRPLRLTFDPALDLAPAWSPDGENIAFLRDLGAWRAAVILVPALGGRERKLAEIHSGFIWGPYARVRLSWSPDSAWLVTSDQSSASEPGALFLVSTESGEKRRLTSPSALSPWMGDVTPAFSSDGRNLVFARGAILYSLALSKDLSPQGEPWRLTPPEWRLAANYPVWTPDGRYILFVGGGGGGSAGGLWKIAASRSAMPVKASAGEFGNEPALSLDGRRLVYTRGAWSRDTWRLELSRPGSPAGSPVRLISSISLDSCPRYSPDGRKIAFVSSRSGFQEIWICDADGLNLIQLTHFKGDAAGTPRWSPDGNRIAFDVLVGGRSDVFTISVDGGKPQRVTDSQAVDACPSWSRDGKWIYFASNRTGGDQVWKSPAGGGEPIQVTKRGGFAAFETNDGKSLYYSKRTPLSQGGITRMSFWKLALGSGEETPVIEEPLLLTYDFALVDQGVYFGSEVAEGSALLFLNFADGKIKRVITIPGRAFTRVGASPDGRWLLYDRSNPRESELMLVENFHWRP